MIKSTAMRKKAEITVEITQAYKPAAVNKKNLEQIVRYVCVHYGAGEITVSIAIVDDREIMRVNKRFLDHRYNTDVISFDLSERQEPDEEQVFELIVNGEKAIKEAKLRSHAAEAEVALYVTHGLLHNFGFNDVEPKEAAKMHDTEDQILKRFGFGLVYNS